jgi:hypothetical protein
VTVAPKDAYSIAAAKLLAEGFALNTRTCFYERGAERLKLRWNGRVYARRRGPPIVQALDDTL